MITFSGLSHVFVPLFLPDTFVGGQRRDPSQQQPHALLDSLSADCSERPAAVAAGAQPGPGFWPQRPRKKEGFGGRTVESRGLRIDHYIYIYISLSLYVGRGSYQTFRLRITPSDLKTGLVCCSSQLLSCRVPAPSPPVPLIAQTSRRSCRVS